MSRAAAIVVGVIAFVLPGAAMAEPIHELDAGQLSKRYVREGCAFRLKVDSFAAGGGEATARFYRSTWKRCKRVQPAFLPHNLLVLELAFPGVPGVPVTIPESSVSGRGVDRFGRYYVVRSRYSEPGTVVTGAWVFENPEHRVRFRLKAAAPPPSPCANAEVQVGYALASGCFSDAGGGRLVSTGLVEIGGVRATPGAGGRVFVDPTRNAVSSEGPVDVRWGPIEVKGGLRALKPGQLTTRLTLNGLDRGLRALNLFRTVARIQPLDFEFGWGGDGRSSSVTGSLDLQALPLPKWVRAQFPLKKGSRRPITVKLGAKNGLEGLDPETFRLTVERVRLDLETGKSRAPALRLPITRLEVRRESTAAGVPWVLEGEIDPRGEGRRRDPSKDKIYILRLFWDAGSFFEDWPTGGGIAVGGLGDRISIGKRLEVDQLGLDFRWQPFGARGMAKLGVLKKVEVPNLGEMYPLEIDAELGLLALARSSCNPLAYPLSVNGKASIPPIEKLGGTASGDLTICGDMRGLGIGELALSGGETTGWTFGGSMSIGFLGFELESGTFDGWLLPNGFQITAARNARVPPFNDVFARVLLNQKAIAVCAQVKVLGRTIASPGFAYEWSNGRRGVHGCNLAPWELEKPETVPSAAQAGQSIRVPAGQRRFGLRVTGQGAAPTVLLRGPGGVVLSAAGSDAQVTPQGAAWRDQLEPSAYFFLNRPRRGTWTIEPQTGSAAIAGVATGRARPALRPRVRVSGRGARRTLRWRVNLLRGDRLRLVERGPGVSHQLAVTGRRRGRLRFRPAAGGSRRRAVYAVVERGSAALEQRRVARFRVSRPRGLGAPRGVRARAGRRAVRVSWRRVRRARGYRVILRIGRGGPRLATVTRGRRARFRVRARRGARAEVRALGADGSLGRAATVRVRR